MSEPADIAPNARQTAQLGLARMLGAVRAQLQQLQTLRPGVGGPSSMTVTRQVTGLQLVELNLPALIDYALQLEGIAAGLAKANRPPDYSDELLLIRDELARMGKEPTATRLLALVSALQAAYATGVTIADPTPPAAPTATAPTTATPTVVSPGPTVPTAPNVLLSTYSAAWSDGYRAGHPAGYQAGYGAGYQAAWPTGWSAGRAVGWAAAYLLAWRTAVRTTWDDVLARITARL